MKKYSLSYLCENLFNANFAIYELENKKWWGRKNKTATSKEIDNWDEVSRAWNEKRSIIKRDIDVTLREKFHDESSQSIDEQFLFKVLPISLMIDMLTIERIKIFDLKKKKNVSGVVRARNKMKALSKIIDQSIKKIAVEKKYEIAQEARTF